MPYRLWQGLCSLKLTLILLFALAGVALVGTVVPQNLAPEAYLRIYPQPVWTLLRAMGVHDLYRAWWFLALPGLLGLNLAACTLQRLPGMWRSVMRPRLRPDPVWLLSLVQHAAWSVPAPQETIDFRLAALLRQHFARPRLLRGDGRNWLFAQKNAWARFSVGGIPIREIMQTDVVTVGADLSLKEAARLLLEEKYGCLPVICDGKLCGIITEADFLRLTIDLMDAVEPED